jgi:hypothetical protein
MLDGYTCRTYTPAHDARNSRQLRRQEEVAGPNAMWVRLEFPVTGTVKLDGVSVHGTVISRDPHSRELWLLTDGSDPIAALADGQGYAIYPEEFIPDDRQRALLQLR